MFAVVSGHRLELLHLLLHVRSLLPLAPVPSMKKVSVMSPGFIFLKSIRLLVVPGALSAVVLHLIGQGDLVGIDEGREFGDRLPASSLGVRRP